MINPASVMKLMKIKNRFSADHPKVIAFIDAVARRGVQVGSVMEITITNPDGTTMKTNMKVQTSDIELVEELKNLSR